MQHFGRLAALGEHKHDVVRVEPAEIAVKGLGRMQEVRADAG